MFIKFSLVSILNDQYLRKVGAGTGLLTPICVGVWGFYFLHRFSNLS
jgi:hypothetical protein